MIDALQLDEAQGLTEAAARSWMEARGWTFEAAKDGGTPWPSKGTKHLHSWQWNPSLFLKEVALIEGLSLQALLREMNPRMRKGKPSFAARMTHLQRGGKWLCAYVKMGSWDENKPYLHELWTSPDGELHNTNTGDEHKLSDAELDEYEVWPCDGRGNKLRWPEVDGVPL